MAASRLEKVGTIFSRVTGLIRSGAMKEEDIPLWYNIYKAFPPPVEPRYDRPAPNIPIRNIFYHEDQIRAKFHKLHGDSLGTIDMNDTKTATATQQFLAIYSRLKEEGNTPEDQVFDAAVNALKIQRALSTQKVAPEVSDRSKSLVSTFREAQDKGQINIKDIFRE